MQKNWKALTLTAIIALLLVFAPFQTEADFGDFGGGSDYGDYGGSPWGDDDYDYSWGSDSNDDYNGDWGSIFGGPSGSGTESEVDWENMDWPMTILGLLFVIGFGAVPVIIIRRVIKALKKPSPYERTVQNQSGPRPAGAARTENLLPMEELYKWDPNFSADALRRRLSNLYVQMQNCWTAMDITPLRGDFTDEQFAQYDRQLDQYRDKGIINKIERISVLDVTLVGVRRQAKTETLVAEIYTRITTYTVKADTNEIVRGNPNEEKFMRYEWTLVRPAGTQTNTELKDDAFPCPQCGAPMNINQSAKCPYCGAIVRRAEFDWVIAQIKGLSQQTK